MVAFIQPGMVNLIFLKMPHGAPGKPRGNGLYYLEYVEKFPTYSDIGQISESRVARSPRNELSLRSCLSL
jgi:hypothetical protein